MTKTEIDNLIKEAKTSCGNSMSAKMEQFIYLNPFNHKSGTLVTKEQVIKDLKILRLTYD